jgi:transcriptional regulator with PAS, ATPase and Fis domain
MIYDRLAQRSRQRDGEPILSALEHEMIRRALRDLDHNQVQVARLLGLSRQTLRKRLDGGIGTRPDRHNDADEVD